MAGQRASRMQCFLLRIWTVNHDANRPRGRLTPMRYSELACRAVAAALRGEVACQPCQARRLLLHELARCNGWKHPPP